MAAVGVALLRPVSRRGRLLPLLLGTVLAVSGNPGHSRTTGGDPETAGHDHRSAADLRVEAGWIRAMPPGQPVTAAFMTLVNVSDRERRVAAISSPIAGRVEIHRTVQHQGRSRMERVDVLAIPPGDRVTLAPGGMHMMLMELHRQPEVGERLGLRLTLDDGTKLDFDLPVTDIRRDSGAQAHHHH